MTQYDVQTSLNSLLSVLKVFVLQIQSTTKSFEDIES